MSDILCRWLNQELQLSKAVEPKTIAKDFASGYLMGEVLHKYQLQNDFNMFMKKDTSVSKLNNFTRLEPTLQLLGISFDINTAQDLIQEKQGAATRLLYQLYVSLEKNRKAEISGTMMEIMQPAGCASLHKKEHQIYSDRLRQVVKRDTELKLQKISQHYEEKFQQFVVTPPIEQKRQVKVQDEKRLKNIDKLQAFHQKHKGMTFNQTTYMQVPKPPPYISQLSLKKRQQQQKRKERQAQIVQTEIAQFETNRKMVITAGLSSSGQSPIDFSLGSSSQGRDLLGRGNKVMLQSSNRYIQEIRKRLEENAVACKEREKRQDRFLVEQLKVHEAQEEARREEQLVKRLTRQTQQEQRLATQLLQIRMQKEVIRENRLFREQQYQQRRERDFQEALDREAALAQQAKLDRAEEIKKELEFCNRIAVERTQRKYKKHFENCRGILEQIMDLATKVGEYRLLNGNRIPEKLMREWKALLFSGLPLYEPIKDRQPGFGFREPLDTIELQKQEILNNQDYDEYTNMMGEWGWPEEAVEVKLPVTNNDILGYIVQRLKNVVDPPITEPSSSLFPHFILKACVLGKFCSGKTTCLSKIAEAHGIYVLSTDTLSEEALNAHKNGEKGTTQQREEDNEQPLANTSVKSDLENQEENRAGNATLSKRAIQGAAVEKELRKGNTIPNELLVDIIVEAISQLPSQSGWILDGFPFDIAQAHLLEKALGGDVSLEKEVVNSSKNLAKDPNPPKPPPPPAPVLDLVLLLDIPDEHAISRGYTKMDLDDAPRTSQHADKNVYLAQIGHRITAFQDTWPKLEKWFGEKQNILVRVDADVDVQELYSRVESILHQAMLKTQGAFSSPPVEDAVLDSAKAPKLSSSSVPSGVDQPTALTEETIEPTESCSSLKEEEVQSLRGPSRSASVSSVCSVSCQGAPKNSPKSKSFCPRSSVQLYVNEPLPPEIPEYLCSYWDTLCDSYVDGVKTVMQELRLQRSVINHHLFNIREHYKHYLGRPDLKQELVSQWQKNFNSIPDDMKEDEDTKEELHLRLDELRERLWDITDKRKEKDEQERASLMSDGWLEEHIVVLVNHHSILTQVELNRFQETLCILRVYYLSMCGQMLPKPLSTFFYVPLMENTENKDQAERSEPPGSSLCNLDEGEDKKKLHFTPLTRHPDASGRVSKTKGQDQPEPVQPPHEKLISGYEEALTAISNLVSGETDRSEIKEQDEKLPEKEKEKASTSENKTNKQKESSKKDQSSLPQTPSQATAEERNSEKPYNPKVREKLHREYSAAVTHEEDAVKARIALVKAHGLVMVQSLQSTAEEIFGNMEKWLHERYLAEMKSIDQLTEVVHHHIETGAKLKNELVLECSDFYLNGDCRVVASPLPPPRPPPLEKPMRSTPTIAQLELLYQQLYSISPSGFMSTSGFFSLLKDIITTNMGKDTLPEPWMDKSESQLMEIVSSLTDSYELVDWRRFLLSAALPWPFPLLSQLLDVLQQFKAADTGDTGYINEENYLRTELWFSTESVQTVPEDPSEPVPYVRLANLRKFFFHMFADHSFSPSRLDYVSMLKYFAADPNPTQGFIRALSMVLGQKLTHSSLSHLVKSMPIIEENADFSSSELDYKEEGALSASSILGDEQEVSIPALLSVICHKITKMEDKSHVPSGSPNQKEHTANLVEVFRELGYDPEDHVPFSILSQHPSVLSLMESCTHHQLVNIHGVLLDSQHGGETNSSRLS